MTADQGDLAQGHTLNVNTGLSGSGSSGPPPKRARLAWLSLVVPLLALVFVGAVAIGIGVGRSQRSESSGRRARQPAISSTTALGASTAAAAPVTAAPAPSVAPASAGPATTATTAQGVPVPAPTGIGPLRLGMSTSAAQATGWLGARSPDSCPAEIDGSTTDDDWELSGPAAAAGIKGRAYTDQGKLVSVFLETWAPTGEGVRKGMPILEAVQGLIAAGYTVEKSDSVFQEHYSAVKAGSSYYIFIETGTADGLSLGSPPFCD